MRPSVRIFVTASVFLGVLSLAPAAQKTILPYDHIHVNVPAAEGSAWYESHLPGGRRIIESPNRIMYGSTRLMFLGSTNTGSSQGSAIEHIGFSVPDVDAKVAELQAAKAKVIEPSRMVPGLYKTALLEDPWGIRVQLVQDPDIVGLHHMQLRAPDPEAYYTWLLNAFGGERMKIKGTQDAVKYAGVPGFSQVYIIVQRGDAVPSLGRAIDHIGWRSIGGAPDTMKMLTGKAIELETPVGRNGQPAVPARLALAGNNTEIFYFYIKGPNGTRIEIVERPGIKPGE